MTKIPHPTDRHVGARVRLRRISAGVSQQRLGDALGVTFQQIQKYEKGANRISASRLQHIANVFGVSISEFFDGAPAIAPQGLVDPAKNMTTQMTAFLATPEGARLSGAFCRIGSGLVRRQVIDLVEALGVDDRAFP
jgi:transcriptional regulator with XRE-family HTH domain